ncbi:trigger factor [Acidobacteriota bacterium]
MDHTKNSIKKIGDCKREIELEISADEVKKEFNRLITQYSARSKIRGFRPGKAPIDVVKRMFYPEIKDALVNSLASKALRDEFKAKNINPVGPPLIKNFDFQEGQPLHLKAQFEVWPEFSLPEYKKIKIKNREVAVTEKEINQSLGELQLKSAQYVPVEKRGVVDADYVVAEVKGKDKNTKKFLPTEKVVILAGHSENEKVLDQNLLGMKPDEEKNFTISYEKNHPNKKLSGKVIEYKLKVISIKEKKLPEINDDFAKDLGEFKTLKDLKDKLKEELMASKKNLFKREMADEIVEKISDKMSFELPETIVEQEYFATLKRLLSSRQKTSPQAEELENLKIEAKKRAATNLKNHLILLKIAEKEKLTISEEEISEELKVIARINNLPLARVVESINKEGKKDELKSNLLLKKTVDFLAEQAIIK